MRFWTAYHFVEPFCSLARFLFPSLNYAMTSITPATLLRLMSMVYIPLHHQCHVVDFSPILGCSTHVAYGVAWFSYPFRNFHHCSEPIRALWRRNKLPMSTIAINDLPPFFLALISLAVTLQFVIALNITF